MQDWKINGVPCQRFAHMEAKEYAQVSAGIATTFLSHWAGHVACYEIIGASWSQEGLSERYFKEGMSESEHQWCGRSGFIGQLAGGIALKLSPWRDSLFAAGYHIGTAAEIITYPLHGMEDIKTVRSHGGDADLEYGAYSIMALWLMGPY